MPAGPVILSIGVTVEDISAGERWGMAAGGVFLTLVGLFVAGFIWRWERSARLDAKRLNEVGVAATAEIVPAVPFSGGEDSGVAIRRCR